MKHTNVIALAALSYACASLSDVTAAERYSYLMHATSTDVDVQVSTDDTTSNLANIKVKYGTTTAYGSVATAIGSKSVSSSPASFVYTVHLSGLTAGALYHYSVSVNGGTTWNTDRSFHTGPTAGTPFSFASYSDFRGNPSMHNTLAGKIKGHNPWIVIEPGDMATDSGWSTLNSQYFVANEVALIREAPLYHGPGNHEGWTANTQGFFRPTGYGDYGSFDYGDVHVVCVNSYGGGGVGVGSAQYNFVAADLAASKKTWKVITFHNPAYTSGGSHGDDAALKTMSKNLFEPNGVKLVLTGHNHFYEHLLVNGIHHMILGGGGAPLYTGNTGSNGCLKYVQAYSFGIFEVTASTLTAKIYNSSDSMIDTFVINKAAGGGDTTAPTVPTNLATSGITTTAVTLSWTASTDSVGVTGYDVYRGATLVGSPTTTTFTDTGLTPSTLYSYTVKAKDAAGNVSAASAAKTATTLAVPTDTTPPSAPTGVATSGITTASITITWTASTDNIAVTGYDVYRGATKVGSPTTTTYTDTGLTPSTLYSYTVKAKDAAGNVSAASTAATGTTLADTSAPSVPGGFGTPTSSNVSATISWTASTDNVGVSSYDIYRNGTLVGNSTTTTYTDTGLTASTTYSYTVKAKDAAGNASAASAPVSVTTLATADTTAPSAPSGVAASATSDTAITVTWTAATDNVAVTGYDVYRNGAMVGSSTSTSYSDTGLTASTSYSYTIKAKDAAGNISAASTAASATTQASSATPPPAGGDGSSGSCGFGSGFASLGALLSLMLMARLRHHNLRSGKDL